MSSLPVVSAAFPAMDSCPSAMCLPALEPAEYGGKSFQTELNGLLPTLTVRYFVSAMRRVTETHPQQQKKNTLKHTKKFIDVLSNSACI